MSQFKPAHLKNFHIILPSALLPSAIPSKPLFALLITSTHLAKSADYEDFYKVIFCVLLLLHAF